MDEAKAHPLRDQPGLCCNHGVKKTKIRRSARRNFWVVPGDGILRQRPDLRLLAARGKELKRADAQMACGDTGKNGTGQGGLAPDGLSCRHDRQRPGGGHTRCRHELRDQVFAQHRRDGRLAIAAARERGLSRSLQLKIKAAAIRGDDFAQKMRAPVAKLGREPAELVAGVDLRNRISAGGQAGPGKPLRRLTVGQMQPQITGEGAVQDQKLRGRGCIRHRAQKGSGQVAGIAVVKGNGHKAPRACAAS